MVSTWDTPWHSDTLPLGMEQNTLPQFFMHWDCLVLYHTIRLAVAVDDEGLQI